jgi:hypothetical protein
MQKHILIKPPTNESGGEEDDFEDALSNTRSEEVGKEDEGASGSEGDDGYTLTTIVGVAFAMTTIDRVQY